MDVGCHDDATIGVLSDALRSCDDAPVQTVRTGSPVPISPKSSPRVLTARRVRAARVLAGNPSLRQVAADGGLSYRHLLGVVNATEPLTSSDALDLARVLGVPSEWLARGWSQ